MTVADYGQVWAQAQFDQGWPISFPADWTDEERTVSGDFVIKAILAWSTKDPLKPFKLSNAIIEGALDLQGAAIEAELTFERCRFKGAVVAREANFSRRVRFSLQCVFDSDVTFDNCSATHLWFTQELELTGAVITEPDAIFHAGASFVASRFSGSLCFDGARFLGRQGISLNGAAVSASVFMQSTEFLGPAVFTALQVDLGVFGSRAKFNGWGLLADFSDMRIKFHVLLEDAVFLGPATFELSEIDGNFSLSRSRFFDGDATILFSSMEVGKLADLRGATFWGAVNFYRMVIGGDLRCDGTEFLGTGQTLYGSALKANGEISLINANIHGPADFSNVFSGGRLYCDGATFLSHVWFAGARLASHISMSKARIAGVADFSHLQLSGDLLFSDSSFDSAFRLYSSDIKGSAQLDRSACRGNALFTNMVVDGELQCRHMVFHAEANFISVTCEGTANFDGTKFKGDAGVSFTGARFASHISMANAKVSSKADFSHLRVSGNLLFSSASFDAAFLLYSSDIDGTVQLDRSTCRGVALFTNMVVRGELQCRDMIFHAEANFISVTCEGTAHFDGAKFKGDARFRFFSSMGGYFERTKFHRQADFAGIRLKGSGHFEGARFGGPVAFQTASIEKDLRFEPKRREGALRPTRVIFVAAFDGDGIEVGRELVLLDCVFRRRGALTLRIARIGILACRGNDLKSVECFSVHVRDGLLFDQNVVKEDANLIGIHVAGRAFFRGTIFKKICDLSEANLQGLADFGANAPDHGSDVTPCTFEGAAKFDRTRFGADAQFHGTAFYGTASFKAAKFLGEATFQRLAGGTADSKLTFAKQFDFSHATFSAPVLFAYVAFAATVSFSKCRFLSRVSFSRVDFNGPSADDKYDDSVVFAEARFESQLGLSGTTARRRIAFFCAVLENRLVLGTDCRFDGTVDLRNARLTILDIVHEKRPTPTDLSFLGDLWLDGCTYKRLVHDDIKSEVLWRQFRKNLVTDNEIKFQRQPYLEFERVCRDAGKDKLADQVYFDLRSADGKFERRWLFRLWNGIEWLFFGYGVRPRRLIVAFLTAWIVGAVALVLLRGSVDIGQGVIASLRNLVPGLEKAIKVDLPDAGLLEVTINIAQYALGWALLALLAHRFFKGLKH